MKDSSNCKNCGNVLSSDNFEICDECMKNHNFSKFWLCRNPHFY